MQFAQPDLFSQPAEVYAHIRALARVRASELAAALEQREREMGSDNHDHIMVYNALGVTAEEGRRIDLYQNKGRFLYAQAGRLIEDALMLCFKAADPTAAPLKIPNPAGERPSTFTVDCLAMDVAIEFKWRDATTDGDHVAKEAAKLKAVVEAGYSPVRLVLFEPNRASSRAIQSDLARLYASLGGTYLSGAPAWDYVQAKTGIDLLNALQPSE